MKVLKCLNTALEPANVLDAGAMNSGQDLYMILKYGSGGTILTVNQAKKPMRKAQKTTEKEPENKQFTKG
jgi:hypothetical protein